MLTLRNRIYSIGSHQVFNHSDSSFNIGSIEGTRTLYAWADSTGNIGGPFTDNITLDTQPPVLAILMVPMCTPMNQHLLFPSVLTALRI